VAQALGTSFNKAPTELRLRLFAERKPGSIVWLHLVKWVHCDTRCLKSARSLALKIFLLLLKFVNLELFQWI
jgi:hypothetical protein